MSICSLVGVIFNLNEQLIIKGILESILCSVNIIYFLPDRACTCVNRITYMVLIIAWFIIKAVDKMNFKSILTSRLAANVVCPIIISALELLMNPLRLVATLRS
jgi:hypothetical protein